MPGPTFASGRALVAIGGGHGLAATIRALRRGSDDVTAIVGVSDNGGSSGRLREEFGVPPPGDLRMALAAMCADDAEGRLWERLLQHRFPGDGALAGHPLGNLLITAIWQEAGDVVVGLDAIADAIDAHGRVIPIAAEPLEIVARVGASADHDGAAVVRGQVEVAGSRGRVEDLWLEPADAPATPAAIAAIERAELIVLGPGSWFTSVLAPLRVSGVLEAIASSAARLVLILNLREQVGETTDFSPATHIDVLRAQVPTLRVDTVLADVGHADHHAALVTASTALGASLVIAPVRSSADAGSHDPDLLAAALARLG